MATEVEFTDEFGEWWDTLSPNEQGSVRDGVQLLRVYGTALGYPWSSGVRQSKHGHMRELRVQNQGRPFRVLYAFNPLRDAILLLGGDKTGNERWYEVHVPLAERLYDEYLAELRKEGLV